MSRTTISMLRLLRRLRRKRKDEQKDYLKGRFDRELNYQLWITKGSRFAASTRLSKFSKMSLFALTLFSAYMIIMSVMQALLNLEDLGIDDSIFTFIMISISILILVIGQAIDRSELREKSKRHHECALEISSLYNELRLVKSIAKVENKEIDMQIVSGINSRYQDILTKYDNHSTVDYNKFRSKNRKYKGHNISWAKSKYFAMLYFLRIYFIPAIIMWLPAVFILWVIYKTMILS